MGWEIVMTGQSPPLIDWILGCMFAIAAISGYTAFAVSGPGAVYLRVVAALGWTIWSVRFAWAFAVGDDPVVPPVASIAIALVCSANIVRNIEDSLCDKLRRR